jgi:D-hexose-6-phosphate mutarotase
MGEIESLRRKYGGPDLGFVYAGDGLIKLVVKNKAASAEVFLHGATVTHFQPVTEARPVLFVSEKSHLKPDKAIRGGIPICWPWFGPHPTDARQPQHGLVRSKPWKFTGVTTVDPQHTRLKFEIDPETGLTAAYTVTVGPTLHISLKSRNRGDAPARLEHALHTYFSVGDSQQVSISGLEGATYIDKMAAGKRSTQDGNPIRFTSETDRVYLNTESTCVLRDPVFGRTVSVSKSGSRSTVVWNPWIEKARALSDFGDDEWQRMCCIESANAADNAMELPARNGEHEMTVDIAAEPL